MIRALSPLVLLVLVACQHPPTVKPPAPPPIPRPEPRPIKPGPLRAGDMLVVNCQVTHPTNAQGKADCICRHASTHIDAVDTTKQSLVCR